MAGSSIESNKETITHVWRFSLLPFGHDDRDLLYTRSSLRAPMVSFKHCLRFISVFIHVLLYHFISTLYWTYNVGKMS